MDGQGSDFSWDEPKDVKLCLSVCGAPHSRIAQQVSRVFAGVYLTFTTARKILKTAGHIDPHTVYVQHMYTLKNSQQNHAK